MPGLQLQRGKSTASSVKGRVRREQPQEKAGRRQKNGSRKEGREQVIEQVIEQVREQVIEQAIEKAGILFPGKDEACSGRESLLRQKLEREQEKFFT